MSFHCKKNIVACAPISDKITGFFPARTDELVVNLCSFQSKNRQFSNFEKPRPHIISFTFFKFSVFSKSIKFQVTMPFTNLAFHFNGIGKGLANTCKTYKFCLHEDASHRRTPTDRHHDYCKDNCYCSLFLSSQHYLLENNA